MLPEFQATMRRAVLGDDAETAALLSHVEDDERIGAARRFAAYRNNVVVSLVGVLEDAFPAVAAHAGLSNFRYAASVFAKAQPPTEARLLAYGDGFADWLAGFKPAQATPWLAELARLEWLRNEALFAADAEPLQGTALQRIQPEQIPALRFDLHPSLRLIRSRYPLADLWAAAQGVKEGPEAPLDGGAQHLLVQRPYHTVQQFILTAGEYALLERMAAGVTLAEAAEAAMTAEPALDLQQALFGHLTRGSLAAVHLPDPA